MPRKRRQAAATAVVIRQSRGRYVVNQPGWYLIAVPVMTSVGKEEAEKTDQIKFLPFYVEPRHFKEKDVEVRLPPATVFAKGPYARRNQPMAGFRRTLTLWETE